MTAGDEGFTRKRVEHAYPYLTNLGHDTTFELVPGFGRAWDFWDLTLREWLPIRRSVIHTDEGREAVRHIGQPGFAWERPPTVPAGRRTR